MTQSDKCEKQEQYKQYPIILIPNFTFITIADPVVDWNEPSLSLLSISRQQMLVIQSFIYHVL